MIEITYLVDHPEVVPTLAEWFRDRWPAYYAGRTPEDSAQDFYTEANRKSLPIRLLAFADGDLAGTITLREQALRGFLGLSPGPWGFIR